MQAPSQSATARQGPPVRPAADSGNRATIPPETAATLLRAAAIPVAERRVLAACYHEHRRAGLRNRSAAKAVAARFGFASSVVAAAIFGGVWTCPTCDRTCYRLAGGVRRYIDGGELDPCCEKSLTSPRAGV